VAVDRLDLVQPLVSPDLLGAHRQVVVAQAAEQKHLTPT
jgi:hypothetical protein